ncbi:MAG TPA: glycine--tRNA ligase subunit beta [Terriglobales bacterium]|jgi:glycyl-tRNA synthetase beta chain
MPDFLLEIGCEEIPARMIDAASEELTRRVGDLINRERLATNATVRGFSTPRRLSVIASGVAAAQPDVEEQVMGPSTKVAFNNGQPGPPAQAFAKKVGVDVSALEKVTTPKGEYLSAKVRKIGRSASDVLAEFLPKEISSVYWPKNMYWRKKGELFVRPIRWLVAMLDGAVVPLTFDGVMADKRSHGHRIIGQGLVEIENPSSYVDALHQAGVLGREERLAQIRKALDAATRQIPGARWREDKELLDAVVNLTEFPSVILGNFDREFLELPEEVLVTVMRDHQKYFAVEGADGRLLPHFLAVLNTNGDPSGIIQHGHERVLRARFSDARFFWQIDQKHSLRERTEWLKQVTFQKDLGSYYEKELRVQRVCSWLAERIRQSGIAIRPGVIHKAGFLAKTDLTTDLVKEFTELQGIVGGLYARVQQLDDDLPESTRFMIADVIYDHYKPESMEDSLPRTLEGGVLSLCDKADSIAGMFALGLQPTGSKDPFGLRRQANGIVRIIADYKIPMPLSELFVDAREAYRGSRAEKKFSADVDFASAVRDFFRERLEFYLRDAKGFKYDVVDAVLAVDADDVVDAVARTEAVSKVRPSQDFESISVAFKRIKNILRQAQETGKRVGPKIVENALEDPAEKELAARIPEIASMVEQMRSEKRYEAALIEISKLRPQVDAFFDKVMVMVDDEGIRSNRLALLQALLRSFSTIADFSEIVTEGKA